MISGSGIYAKLRFRRRFPSLPLDGELFDQDLATARSFHVSAFQCRHEYRQIFSLLILQMYFTRFENLHFGIYRGLSVRDVINEWV